MEAAPPSGDSRRRSFLKRIAPLLLVSGAGLSAFVLIPTLPRERHVELRLDDPATVVGVRLDWEVTSQRSAASPDTGPIHGASWRFPPGSAPSSVAMTVRLPDGAYDLDVLVERVGSAETVHRSVKLGDADHVTIPLR